MATVFSRIVNGEIPCYKIAEEDNYFAFLDINPLAKGHTLVIPKIETDYLFDLDNNTLCGLMLFAKRVARAIEKSVDCKRIGVVVLGLEVPHAHLHLVPLQTEADISFSKPKLKLAPGEMEQIANLINANMPLEI